FYFKVRKMECLCNFLIGRIICMRHFISLNFFKVSNYYIFLLASTHTLYIGVLGANGLTPTTPPGSIDFGTSITRLNTFVPANVSAPGLLKLPAVPARIALYWLKSKKKGSSRGPAKNFIPSFSAI